MRAPELKYLPVASVTNVSRRSAGKHAGEKVPGVDLHVAMWAEWCRVYRLPIFGNSPAPNQTLKHGLMQAISLLPGGPRPKVEHPPYKADYCQDQQAQETERNQRPRGDASAFEQRFA